MYHCNLVISLVGIASENTDEIKKIPAFEHFHHEFIVAEDFSDAMLAKSDVLIFSDQVKISIITLRQIIRSDAICIYCTDNQELLTDRELDALDDVWLLSGSVSIWHFNFSRLQKNIKTIKDVWLYKNYLDATIDTLPDMVWFKDAKGAHLKVNDAFCDVVQKTKEDIQGRGHYYIWDLTKEQYEKGEFVCMETEEEVMSKRETCVFDEHVLGKNGLRQLKTYKTPLFDIDGTIMGTLGIARDVTREHQYQQKIFEMANTDALTGLPNRRSFYAYINRSEKEKVIAVTYVDVDNFKLINDSLGHQMGDQALIEVAKTISTVFKNSFTARLGGDEFISVITGYVQADQILEKFNEMNNRLKENSVDVLLAISMGVAYSADKNEPIDKLVRKSDEALYQAKRTGKSKCCFYMDNNSI